MFCFSQDLAAYFDTGYFLLCQNANRSGWMQINIFNIFVSRWMLAKTII